MIKFRVWRNNGNREDWDDVRIGTAWVECRMIGSNDVTYYPSTAIDSVFEYEEVPQPTERRVSWSDLEQRS